MEKLIARTASVGITIFSRQASQTSQAPQARETQLKQQQLI